MIITIIVNRENPRQSIDEHRFDHIESFLLKIDVNYDHNTHKKEIEIYKIMDFRRSVVDFFGVHEILSELSSF
jgi:hypothetical protein